jgi:predicted helicase
MGTVKDLLGGLSQDKDLRGKQFEHICKWLLQTDPVYAAQIRRVWLWREWPGCWGRDAGIDLVAEAHGGALWAIQAKAYDPNCGSPP